MQKHFHATSEFTWYVVRESDDEVLKSSVASADTFESAISDSTRRLLFRYSSYFVLPCQHAAFWCRYEFEMNAHAKRFLTINFGEGTACTCAPLRARGLRIPTVSIPNAILSARKHANIIVINTFDRFQAYLLQDQLFSPLADAEREGRRRMVAVSSPSVVFAHVCVCVCLWGGKV